MNIAANDVCHTPIEETFNQDHFEKSIKRAIDSMIHANPEVKILINLVPEVVNLREVAIDRPYCRTFWSTTNVCKNALHPNRTPEELKSFREKWVLANKSLVKMGTKYPNQVKVPPETAAQFKFTFDHVSPIDCFHPNVEDQNLFSDLSWKYG